MTSCVEEREFLGAAAQFFLFLYFSPLLISLPLFSLPNCPLLHLWFYGEHNVFSLPLSAAAIALQSVFASEKKFQSSSFLSVVADKKQEDLFLINFAFTEPSLCPLERHRPFSNFFLLILWLYTLFAWNKSTFRVFFVRSNSISEKPAYLKKKKYPLPTPSDHSHSFPVVCSFSFFSKTTPTPLISQHIKKNSPPLFLKCRKKFRARRRARTF